MFAVCRTLYINSVARMFGAESPDELEAMGAAVTTCCVYLVAHESVCLGLDRRDCDKFGSGTPGRHL